MKTPKFLNLRFIRHLKVELIRFPVMYGLLLLDNIARYLNIWNLRVQKKQKKTKVVKVVNLCSRVCSIHSHKYMFDIFTVGNLLNICMEHDLYLIS